MRALDLEKKKEKLFRQFINCLLQIDEVSFIGITRFLNIPITEEEKTIYTEEEKENDLAAEAKIQETGTEEEKKELAIKKSLIRFTTETVDGEEITYKFTQKFRNAESLFTEIIETFEKLSARQKKNLIKMVKEAKNSGYPT